MSYFCKAFEKYCLPSLIIRAMQNQNNLMVVRLGKTKMSGNSQCLQGCAEKETLMHYWWEYYLIQSLWKAICRFLKNEIQGAGEIT